MDYSLLVQAVADDVSAIRVAVEKIAAAQQQMAKDAGEAAMDRMLARHKEEHPWLYERPDQRESDPGR